MKITIDTKLLEQQIHICHVRAGTADDKLEMESFIGLENLLSELFCALENNEEIEIEAVEPEVPNGRMTIRELMEYECDIDIVNNVTDSLGCCLVCPKQLTEEGYEDWKDVLDFVVDVYGDDNYAVCIVDDDPNIKWQTKIRRLNCFLNSTAGYCSEEDYDKWFID